ncbi:MAG: phage holin family protein [Betaproteobacteria bacterium]|nr:phage holin family protein [Betaproteobacteria bacterium]
MRLFLRWGLNALALMALPYLFSAIRIEDFWTALIVALVLGLINALVRPILFLLTLPITVFTLGLFIFVLNGLLFLLVANMVPGFSVGGFWPAVGGALVYSIISWVLNSLFADQPGKSK